MFSRLLLFLRPLVAVVFFAAAGAARAEVVTLLADGDVSGWQYKSLDDIPETRYRTAADDEAGRTVLFADSDRGASGYISERDDLDLAKTPWVHFQWRVDAAGTGFDERKKSGDDYAFRLYFVARSGLRYRTLVLARAQGAAGESWRSPYSNFISEVVIHAFADSDSPLGEWQTARINVAELWRDRFGADADLKIGAAGLMTDGDSSGVKMRARYGAVILTASPESPF